MKITKDLLFLTIAALVLAAIRILFPDVYHHFDVKTFIIWGNYADSIRELYNTECYCNYPIVGLLLSTGILKILHNSIASYLYFLVGIDIINLILIYFLLRRFKIKNAGIWAAVIGLLPSSWAGGMLWGQIDNLGQLILILLVLTITFVNTGKKELRNSRFFIYISLLAILMAAGFLTKQLVTFSLIPLALLITVNILIKTGFRIFRSAIYISLIIFIVLLIVALFDSWLIFPDKYFSHMERVLLTGSYHIEAISGNGFNIWMLLNRDMYSSANIPFLFSWTPKITGIILFLLNSAMLTYFLVLKTGMNLNTRLSSELISIYLVYLALINLNLNLFLTGSHERYLYHFYPFLIIALLIMNKGKISLRQNLSLSLSLIGGILYGAFVLGILLNSRYQDAHISMFLFHFILYIVLFSEFASDIDIPLFRKNLKHYLEKN